MVNLVMDMLRQFYLIAAYIYVLFIYISNMNAKA